MASAINILLRRCGPEDAPPASPGAGELRLRFDSRQWASDVVARGLADVPRGEGEVRQVVMYAAGIPTLDEMLAATFAAWLAGGELLPAGAEALGRYAALARAGFSPSRVAAEFSIAGIYQALTWPFGTHLADDAAAGKFVAEWQRMAGVLEQALRAGKDPFTEPLFSESGGFAREIISLRADRQVYGQDVKAGMRFRIQLAAEGPVNAALILRQPRSLLFKEWARSDAQSPTGDGYLILGVEWDAGDWVFSTDPVQRISLKPLAEALTARQREVVGEAAEPWFDGAPFEHTLIAAPKAGTLLPPKAVLAVFSKWSRARPVQAGAVGAAGGAGGSHRLRWIGMAACVALVACVAWWGLTRPTEPVDPSIGAVELDQLHVISLKSRSIGNNDNLGLFVGVNEFRNNDFPQLTFAVDDAIAQAHLFSLELDLIEPGNVVLAIQGVPGTRRGAQQLKELQAKGATVTTASKTDIISGLDKLNSISRQRTVPGGLLIVSVSTHGLQVTEGAYVIPSDGMRAHIEQDIGVADLGRLMGESRATKRLLIVDACRENAAGNSRDVPAAMSGSFLEALAAAKGEKVMASCSAGQLSYEVPAKGHGVFTYWLLMALKGQAPADGRGMITVGTVEEYLKKQVAEYSARHAPGEQVPWFSADEGAGDIPLALPEKP